MRHIRTLHIFLILIFLSSTPCLHAATEQRTALVIGNGSYSFSPLKNPVNDASDIAATLQRLGFSVTLKKDADHQEMEESIREFGEQLKKGGVGLFFYAGHGVQIGGRNYLLPVGANINKETDFKFRAVDAEMVLAEMGEAGNPLNIVILDACRDNPFGRSFRTVTRGLAIISDAPKGTFITYSTSPGKVAAEGSGRNSPYTESLIRYMSTPGLPIEEVFKKVRQDMGKKTKGQQVPWELSSLEGQFFFIPTKDAKSDTVAAAVAPTFDYEAEQRKIEADNEQLRKEKELLEKKRALADEKRRLAEEREQIEAEQQEAAEAARKAARTKKTKKTARAKTGDDTKTMAMARPPQEIRRDGRFIAYDNGTVLDTSTNLMWAAKDNGKDINWDDAKSYCENYRAGGYTDWRVPFLDELKGLYDVNKSQKAECLLKFFSSKEVNHVATDLIHLTCSWVWASETHGSEANALFDFWISSDSTMFPKDNYIVISKAHGLFVLRRALPVRSGK